MDAIQFLLKLQQNPAAVVPPWLGAVLILVLLAILAQAAQFYIKLVYTLWLAVWTLIKLGLRIAWRLVCIAWSAPLLTLLTAAVASFEFNKH